MHNFIPRWCIHGWVGVGPFGTTASEAAIHQVVYTCNADSFRSETIGKRYHTIKLEPWEWVGIERSITEEIIASSFESKS